MTVDQRCLVLMITLCQFTHLDTRDSDILKSRLFQYFSHFYEVFIQLHLADAYTLLIMSADVISDSQKQDDYQHL